MPDVEAGDLRLLLDPIRRSHSQHRTERKRRESRDRLEKSRSCQRIGLERQIDAADVHQHVMAA